MLIEIPRKLPSHFSDIIREVFQNRALKNQNYSLRAFARDLGLTSGNLSDLINQKVGLSSDKACLIVENLKLNAEDKKLFLKLVDCSLAKSSDVRKTIDSEILKYDSSYIKLNDDYYKVLTEWYYFALVELVKVVGFQNNDDWIAKRINIPLLEVRPVIERLKRVELLEEVAGELVQTYDYFISPSGTPLDAAKKFHKQILSNAIIAIDNQEIEARDYTSGFLRVRKSDLPYISKRIKDFRRELAKEIEAGDGHDSVYAFGIQFFRGDC